MTRRPDDPFLAFVELAADALMAQQRATVEQRQRATQREALGELAALRRQAEARAAEVAARRERRKARELASRVEWRAATLGEALRHARGRALLFGTDRDLGEWIDVREWGSIGEQRAAIVAAESPEIHSVRWLVPA